MDPSYFIDTKRPFSLENWLNYWMPWIRDVLSLKNNDEQIVRLWSNKGIVNDNFPILKHPKTICFAPGPELESQTSILQAFDLGNYNIFSANGATAYLTDLDIQPDIVFTDLDGLDKKLVRKIIKDGVWMFILAHGDNIHLVKTYLDLLLNYKNIVWCTQGRPLLDWVNTLGFTDGDRGVSYAVSCGTVPLLIGFDLNATIRGRFSRSPYSSHHPITRIKSIKLHIAWKVLSWIYYSNNYYTINASGSPGIELSFNDFTKLKQ